MSKVSLDFGTERLEEHTKSERVEDEALKVLVSDHEADRTLRGTEYIEVKVIAKKIEIKRPSKLVTQRKLLEEVLQVEMLKHMEFVKSIDTHTRY
ncbi:hypothetical protein BKA82DRAFT_33722 [Pisolithus tinctorius]|uniref:Uncharacterized protein n=1 Tax=Pisolithus tinctorius Marx 270 TaxID=870435 RepID=A0A0C3NKZ9_PISTI|nr:hypothetical protein BKA82DRAFT_33722 [Pisolithus tinctorius]KIN95978.1 hypothetical protein M404DRAFT_33722 [Pisolithus tinctorius Marx 270]